MDVIAYLMYLTSRVDFFQHSVLYMTKLFSVIIMKGNK